MSRFIAKRVMGVQVIDAEGPLADHEKYVIEKVHRLSRAAGLAHMPEVGIYGSPEVNAFATGPSKKRSLVAVSTGLLNEMDDDAIEGVIAHEVAHVANGDMVTMTLLRSEERRVGKECRSGWSPERYIESDERCTSTESDDSMM